MLFEGIARNAVDVSRHVVRTPGAIVERIGEAGLSMFTQTLELVAPKQTQKEFVRSLKRDQHRAELGCAIGTVKTAARKTTQAQQLMAAGQVLGKEDLTQEAIGKIEDATILRTIGYTMLKKAIVRAHKSEEVPDFRTQELVFTALEHGADPDKSGFLRPEEAEAVSEVFDKFDNVTVFPSPK